MAKKEFKVPPDTQGAANSASASVCGLGPVPRHRNYAGRFGPGYDASMSCGHAEPARWEFGIPHNTAAFVCKRVSAGAPVLFVSHDEDGNWSFLCGGEHSDVAGLDGALLVCMGCTVARDPSLNDLADLPCNHEGIRERPGAPWVLHDRGEDFVVDAVRKYGWAVQLIPAGDETEPAFAYTVGLFASFGHPELIVFGLPHDVMHAMLNACGELVRGGTKLSPGVLLADILEEHPVRLRSVVERRSYEQHVGYATWFNKGREFPLLQVMWPDKHGHFPGEDGFDTALRNLQPSLP